MSKPDKPMVFRGKYVLLAVLAAYALVFAVDSAAGMAAMLKSGAVAVKILPVIAGVIVFTALINYTLPPERIVRHLGRNSGVRGWVWALLAGIISHGPIYIWYPTLEELRRHGMRDALIVTLFAARVVKLPLLPLMVGYFGLEFTLILSFYILAGALIQGWLVEKLERTGAA